MDELVDDTLFLRPSSVNTLTSKKSYNWLWILGGVLIIIILFIWIISNSDELKTRYEFLKFIQGASDNSTNIEGLSDEIINNVVIPSMCELPDSCINLQGKKLVKCAQDESLVSSEFEQCIMKQATSQNDSNLCYALATFAQSMCLPQVYYLNENIEGCRSLDDMKDYCILQISNRIGETTYCNEIENKNQREQCLKLEWPKQFKILSPLPNDTWTNSGSYIIKWEKLSTEAMSNLKGDNINVLMLIIPEGDFVVSLNKSFKIKNNERQYNFSFSSEDKLLNLTSGKYRLVFEFFGLDSQKTFLGRGEVSSITLGTGILSINKSLNTKINPDAPKPVPSADVYVIFETPPEIEINFALSPDDLNGEQDVSYYEIWRADSVSKSPIKLGEVSHSQAIYVDSDVNNPDNFPEKGVNYYYFIRTYDFDGNYADSINFSLSS